MYAVKLRDTDHLKQRIAEACAQIQPDVLERVIVDRKKQVQKCLNLEGQHRTHIIRIYSECNLQLKFFFVIIVKVIIPCIS